MSGSAELPETALNSETQLFSFRFSPRRESSVLPTLFLLLSSQDIL